MAGAGRTRAQFRWTNKQLLVDIGGRAAQAAADEVLKVALQRVPVRTGRLKRSIRRWRVGTVWHVGTDVEYAPYVEFGTRRMRAQPFLGPALESARRLFRAGG